MTTTPSVWFTSDLHLGHANIIRYCDRPFADVPAMNDGLIQRWNEVVEPTDTVWVLGDVAMGLITESLPLVGRLHGVKHLVTGNHDRCFDADRHPDGKAAAWEQRYLDAGFATVAHGQVQLVLSVAGGDGLAFQACHFPYRGDSGDHDRYVDRRPTDDGEWLLHGHVHERWRWHRRMINVGVDAWDYAPVAAATVAATVAEYDRTAPSTTVELDGAVMTDLAALYDQVSERIIPGASWGRNLDAFNDVLRGGFGTPDDGLHIVWRDAATARRHLGEDFATVVEILDGHAPGADRHGRPTGSNIRVDLR